VADRAGSRVRVLIVDDDPDTRWMTQEALGDHYDAVSAASRAEALARVRDQPPDAIVLDLTLAEGETGWELIRSLQADPALARVPIIIVSARAPAPPPAGVGPCATYLTKPCRMTDLRAVVARFLAKAPTAPTGGGAPREAAGAHER
jgi:CheY-like chemotaxis protein